MQVTQPPPMKVLWTGAVPDLSGYGSASREYVRSLDAVGIDVAVDAKSFEPWKPNTIVEQVLDRRMYTLMAKDKGAPIHIIHLTPENYPPYASSSKTRIGYYAWETSKLPGSWVSATNKTVVEAWVPCQYLADISVQSGVTCPVVVVPHAIPAPPEDWHPKSKVKVPEDRFKFYSIFQWCHDDQTRVLTESGFKYFKDLLPDDRLATVNLESRQLEYQIPDRIVASPYQGELFSLNSKQFNFSITPNHRLLTRRDGSDKWELVEAKDLLSQDGTNFKETFQTLKWVKWVGNEPDFFYPPKVDQKQGRNTSLEKIEMDKFLNFLGWYMSEGSTHIAKRGYRVEIAQIRNAAFIEEIVDSVRDIWL